MSFGLLIVIGFGAIAAAFPALARRHAVRWQIRGVDDPGYTRISTAMRWKANQPRDSAP